MPVSIRRRGEIRRGPLPFGKRGGTGSTWSPLRIQNLALWLRSDAGITLNGGDVSAWADQSGNGNDATQATAIDQPLYVASDPKLNGYPSVSFDGANHCMSVADVPELRAANGEGFTVYFAYYPDGDGASTEMFYSKYPASNAEFYLRHRWGNNENDFQAAVNQADNLGNHVTSGTTTIKNKALNLFRFSWHEDGADSHFYRQEGIEGSGTLGIAQGQGAYVPGTPGPLEIGCLNGANNFRGRFAEILHINRYIVPGSGEDTTIMNYLEGKYAVTPSSVLGSDMKLWLRADLGVTLNGGDVAALADQSGNNNDATQATAANQPLYVASDADFYSRATIDFTAANNDRLVIADSDTLGNEDDTLIAMVMSHPSSASLNDVLSKFNNPYEWLIRHDTTNNMRALLRNASNDANAQAIHAASVADATVPILVEVRTDVSACLVGINVNNATEVTDTDPAVPALTPDPGSALGIGANPDGTRSASLTFAELVIAQRNGGFTADERERLRSCYYARRYQRSFGG